MTLITNEIHLLDGLNKTMLVFAADGRISDPITGKPLGTRPKLFEIKYLEAGISYYGLADVFPSGKSRKLSDWLSGFIRKQTDVSDLGTFAHRLREALHAIIPPPMLQKYPSGFHILGYNADNLPEFWHLTNVGNSEDFIYKNLQPRYFEPSSDFLERDARIHFCWDGTDPGSARNGICYYRNGDYRPHAVAWEKLDEILEDMFRFKDFRRPKTTKDYEEYVKTKIGILAYIYKKFATRPIIGPKIDAFCLSRL